MGEFVKAAEVGEIPVGEGRAYLVQGRRVAIFHQGGEYFAIDDTCPHMGASLAEGYLEDHGVICPWHAWKFCVQTGSWLDNPKSNIKVAQFPVRIAGEEIQIQIPDPPGGRTTLADNP